MIGDDQILDVELDRSTPFRAEIPSVPLRLPVAALNRQADPPLAVLPITTSAAPQSAVYSEPGTSGELIMLYSVNCSAPIYLSFYIVSEDVRLLGPILKKLVVKIPLTSQGQ